MLHAEEHTAQVDVHRLVVVRHRHVGNQRGVGDAGHVAHDVDAAELVDRGFDHGLHVGFVRHVAVHGEHAGADLGRGFLFRAAEVGRHHLRAFAHEDLHRRLGHS